MTRYDDNNPQHRKELNDYLTRPKDNLKSKGAFRSFVNDQKKQINVPGPLEQLTDNTEKEILKDPNLLRRIKYLTKTYDNIDLGKDFDKAIAQEDKNLAVARGRTITQRYPKEASPKQMAELKEKIDKYKYVHFDNKPKAKKPLPPVKLPEIPRFDLNAFKLPEPDPRTKALEENFNRIRKETEKEKIRRRTTGLAGLLPE
tara:strand:- start:2417 stop:3019 length:603 start_codon:yes stop_codon:yes gene_type:complete